MIDKEGQRHRHLLSHERLTLRDGTSGMMCVHSVPVSICTCVRMCVCVWERWMRGGGGLRCVSVRVCVFNLTN